jgi:geranylgeranyl pyrophosphate synthase
MAAEMRQVDDVIRRRLQSDVVLINQIAHYIVSAGGKRIRPRLVLLFAAAFGFTGHERFELAATVEFIHTATLLHDDVVAASRTADRERAVRQRCQRTGRRLPLLARLPDDGRRGAHAGARGSGGRHQCHRRG